MENTTAQRIKIAMEIREMTQAELVEKTGINKGALSSYIAGRYKPKQTNTYLIAKALHVSEAWLMGADVPMEPDEQDSTPTDSYYLDDKAREAADFLHKHPEYQVLFDASRKVKAEDIDFVKEMIDRMSGES